MNDAPDSAFRAPSRAPNASTERHPAEPACAHGSASLVAHSPCSFWERPALRSGWTKRNSFRSASLLRRSVVMYAVRYIVQRAAAKWSCLAG
jgi:hypothetical protein